MMRANRVRELHRLRQNPGGPFYWRGRPELGHWLRERGYIQQYPGRGVWRSNEWRISLAGMAALVVAVREYDARGRLSELFSHGVAPR